MAVRIVRHDGAVGPILGIPHLSALAQRKQQPLPEPPNAYAGQAPHERSLFDAEPEALGYLDDRRLRSHQAVRFAGPHAAQALLLQQHASLALWYRGQD